MSSRYDKLSEVCKAKVRTWFKHFEDDIKVDLNQLKWILINHERIHDFIISKYDNLNTRGIHFYVLATVMSELDHTILQEKYTILSSESKNKHNALYYDKNILTNRQKTNNVTWNQLMTKRKELKKLFYEDTTNNCNNMLFLVISLYTYQPPLRLDYVNMKIINNLECDDKKHNFLYDNDSTYSVIINSDKVSHVRGSSTIPIISKILTKIIRFSLKCYPRDYLLSQFINNKSMSQSFFNKHMTHMFDDKYVSVDVYRSVYISNFYSNLTMDEDQMPIFRSNFHKIQLAKLMRHSPRIANMVYYKYTPEQLKIFDMYKDQADKEVGIVTKDNRESNNCKEPSEKSREYSNKYYQKNKLRETCKRILRNANSGKYVPTSASINKYKLVCNDNVWSSILFP